ncbi:tumor necrosis factor receptor superfamily member 1A isoform X1 [Entelurus aequoreus]|uniref:tumor necrosis factor receptor superfamily member 1A isoform X1 n=1 Tax=Entelurus aequoreus TaxID=161455 RepID=UPI002B1E6241|nr:tumor necrosis factor receptor superfamily member 1A isoform X1 [Entelurus aequoreus]
MDLIFLLLALFSIGHCDDSNDPCSCPAGHYKKGNCLNSISERCGQCENGTYTANNNTMNRCFSCSRCEGNLVEKQKCTSKSDVICDCKDGYYKVETSCQACYCEACENRDCAACLSREQCLKDAKCKKKCATTTTTTSFTTETRDFNSNESRNEAPLNAGNNVQWWMIMILVVVFCICVASYPCSHPCCRINKNPGKDTECFNETQSYSSSDPTTVTVKVCKKTTMMIPFQTSVAPVHMDHMDAVLPNNVSRQERACERWPPMVLYAIIKEVPLRRWKEFLRLLSVADHQLERVELEVGLGLLERQYQMLLLWSQGSSSGLEHVFSALHSMDLSGCAQTLQENLEKLQRRNQSNEAFITC